MDGQSAASDAPTLSDLGTLSWLAECQRNGFLAVPLPTEVRGALDRFNRPWSTGLYCSEFDLAYEPRSIAASPDGRRVAIGTKTGTIHCAVLQNGNWRLEDPISLAPDTAVAARNAIRGLAFLGNDQLVAGRSRGIFSIVELDAGTSAPQDCHSEVPARGPQEDPVQAAGEDAWLLRFSAILPLFPGCQVPQGDQTALALGLTPSRVLHLLRRHGNSFAASRILPEDLFGPASGGIWLVDGHWCGAAGEERLWLLDSSGKLYRYRLGGDGPLGIEPDPSGDRGPVFPVPYLRPRADPRSFSYCRAGLAMRFGDDVTFLPFGWFRSDEPQPPQWVQVPGALRCLAVQEFDSKNHAYLAVATSEAGLRWIPWQFQEAPGMEAGGPVFRDDQPLMFEGVGGSILEMVLVHPEGAPILLQATRHHRLRIVSLLDMNAVNGHMTGGENLITPQPLSALIDRFLAQPAAVEDGLQSFFLSSASRGVALRVVQRLIQQSFQMREAARDTSEWRAKLAPLLERLELADLHKTLRRLKRSWPDKATVPLGKDGSRSDLYRSFCLLIFQRAARIDAATLPELARIAFDDIEKDLRRKLRDEEWRPLSVFGGFLRKWFIYGYTYGEKRYRLLDLAEWNRDCRRNADALFYLTRLLHSRVDTRWVRKVETTTVSAAVWDITAPPEVEFLLHTHSDGRIFATDAGGRAVCWRRSEGAKGLASVLARGQIAIQDEGKALCHSEADTYRALYRNGPYARCLHLHKLAKDLFILVFGMRGWQQTDFSASADAAHDWQCHPRLVALEVRWQPGKEPERQSFLEIREAAIRITAETYAITALPARQDSEKGTLLLAVGTGGVWTEPDTAEVKPRRRLPFVEVEIKRRATALNSTHFATTGLSMVVHEPRVEDDLRWRGFERNQGSQALLDQGSNPSWSADALEIEDPTRGRRVWLWIGTNDGRVRSFLWDEDRWREGGGALHAASQCATVAANATVSPGDNYRPALDPIVTHSPVRKLRCLLPPHGVTPQHPLLAYGTADGVVGVVPLDRLTRTAAGDACADKPGLPWAHLVKSGEPGLPWGHLVHSRQRSGIRGLADYTDGVQWNLAVLTEGGQLILYHLGRSKGPPASGFMHRGLRLDKFEVPQDGGRALAAFSRPQEEVWKALRRYPAAGGNGVTIGDDEQAARGTLPMLVIGDREGAIGCKDLVVPMYSLRRNRRVVPLVRNLVAIEAGERPDSPRRGLFASSVGGEILSWLRLCDVKQPNLLRFSIWLDLRQMHASDLPKRAEQGGPPAAEMVAEEAEAYRAKLASLTDEVYGRRPVRHHGAQILWAETGRYARKIAEKYLDSPAESRAWLEAYNGLLLQIDHLCNRWIGQDQALEAEVLIESFAELFNWTAVVLIARAEADPPQEILLETRKILLFKVVQRRLRHGDILVPLEALRTMNEAVLRALQENALRKYRFVHRHPGGQQLGFYDLLALVGELVRQQAGRLTPSDPLYTEISRFFALSILLVPEGSLAVGRMVSTSWLAERGLDVGQRILLQAQIAQQQLAQDILFHEGGDPARSIERFHDYLDRDVDFDLDLCPFEGPLAASAEHPCWRRLLEDRGDATADPLTDRHDLVEQRQLLFTVARLARLSKAESGPAGVTLMAWLDEDGKSSDFNESRRYLRHLRERRDTIKKLLTAENRPDGREEAVGICREELSRLEDWPNLLEPQRSHYRSTIVRWQQQLDQLVGKTFALVRLIDRFNRHVYRNSADDLMASLLDLALRSAPLSFPMPPEVSAEKEVPLRLQIRERIEAFPLIADLFQRGALLVQRSHLAETLLHLAGVQINPGGLDDSQVSPQKTRLEHIWEDGKKIAALEGVEWHAWPEPLLAPAGEMLVPGDEFIWKTVLQELAHNVYTYCAVPGQRNRLHVRWARLEEANSGSYYFLTIAGDRPFYDTMLPQYQAQVGNDPQALCSKVEEIGRTPRARYGIDRRGSFGFGLYFLTQLASLLRIHADLLLLDSEDTISRASLGKDRLIQPHRDNFEALRQLPLTMVFWWHADPGA